MGLLSAKFVDFDEVFSVHGVRENDHVEVRDKVRGDGPLVTLNFDVWVKFTELPDRHLGSGLVPNIAFSGVKVCAKVRCRDGGRVMDGDGLWTSENKIFCGFEAGLG